MEARTVRPVDDKFVNDHEKDSDTMEESDMSSKSGSFLHRVKIECERCRTNPHNIQHKTATNTLNNGNVCAFGIKRICVHVKELSGKITFHQKYRKGSHNETYVWHIWKIDSRKINWDFWSVQNQLVKFTMATIISGQWWRSHWSLACKS